MRLGVEVGGTFTDLVVFNQNCVSVTKVPSTPARPDEGAMNAIRRSGVDLKSVVDLVHGSTVATNAVLERKGARVALLVTQGMRDLLHIQRHTRKHIYDLHYVKPEPIVAHTGIFEIEERLDSSGAAVRTVERARGARNHRSQSRSETI